MGVLSLQREPNQKNMFNQQFQLIRCFKRQTESNVITQSILYNI